MKKTWDNLKNQNFFSGCTGTCWTEHCSLINKNPRWVSLAVKDRCILTLQRDKTELCKMMVTISNSCLPRAPQNKLEFSTKMTNVSLVNILENSQALVQVGRSTVFIASSMSTLSLYFGVFSSMSRSKVCLKAFFYKELTRLVTWSVLFRTMNVEYLVNGHQFECSLTQLTKMS